MWKQVVFVPVMQSRYTVMCCATFFRPICGAVLHFFVLLMTMMNVPPSLLLALDTKTS